MEHEGSRWQPGRVIKALDICPNELPTQQIKHCNSQSCQQVQPYLQHWADATLCCTLSAQAGLQAGMEKRPGDLVCHPE